ncbi:MAG: hypothetical protein RL499_1636 [Actinomycetota bacterium]
MGGVEAAGQPTPTPSTGATKTLNVSAQTADTPTVPTVTPADPEAGPLVASLTLATTVVADMSDHSHL